MEEEYEKVPIKGYFKSEIAEMYDIDAEALRYWLKKAKIHHLMKFDKRLNVCQVRKIFTKLGHPEKKK